MWPTVVADATVGAALVGRAELRQRTIRLWGTPESELAATLRGLGKRLAGLEITTCLRDGELEIVTRYPPDAEEAYAGLAAALVERYEDTLFSVDGRTVDDVVAEALLAGSRTIATAESCTGGLLAARLPGRRHAGQARRPGAPVRCGRGAHPAAADRAAGQSRGRAQASGRGGHAHAAAAPDRLTARASVHRPRAGRRIGRRTRRGVAPGS